jgi:copper chaperone CopZ
MNSTTFMVKSLSSGSMAMIEDELTAIGGVKSVTINVDSKEVVVEWDAPASASFLRDILEDIGYPAS